MKTKKIIGIGIAVIIVAAIACFGVKFYADADYYYTQIDNSQVSQIESDGGVIDFKGGMSYQYELIAYDENGKEKTIRFGTERELKDSALIRLSVKPIQGVVNWSEVQYDELPQEVQSHYAPVQN